MTDLEVLIALAEELNKVPTIVWGVGDVQRLQLWSSMVRRVTEAISVKLMDGGSQYHMYHNGTRVTIHLRGIGTQVWPKREGDM